MRLIACLLLTAVLLTGCSRNDKGDSASPTPPPNLRADAERVHEAIARTAAKRAQATPVESPSPTAPAP